MSSDKSAATPPEPTLMPRLVVRDALAAIAWYTAVFGAREQVRYTMGEGVVAHAALAIGDGAFALTEAASDGQNHDPVALGGSPVVLSLQVDDPDAVVARAVKRGAKVIFPLADQPYGHRGARIADPFGHLWIVFRVIERLDPAEIQRRMAAYEG